MLLDEIARTSAGVAETSSRLRKIEQLSSCLARLGQDEVQAGVAYLSGALPHGAIGVGWASLRDLPAPSVDPPTLQLGVVDATFRRIGALAGAGSQERRTLERHALS